MANGKDWMARIRDIGIILGVIIALGTVGFVMPWNAASKEQLAEVKKVQAEKESEHQKEHGKIDRSLGRIEGRLDSILDILKEGRKRGKKGRRAKARK